MKHFRPVKTNEVVFHQGQQHLVTGLDVRPDGIYLQLQRLETSVKAVPYDQVNLISGDLPKRLSAFHVAKQAWSHGENQAKHPLAEHSRQPYHVDEVANKVKSLLLDALQQDTGARFISQSVLDRAVGRLVVAQSYLVNVSAASQSAERIKSNKKSRAKKSTKTVPPPVETPVNFAGWRDIATIAAKMANTYNKQMLDRVRQGQWDEDSL